MLLRPPQTIQIARKDYLGFSVFSNQRICWSQFLQPRLLTRKANRGWVRVACTTWSDLLAFRNQYLYSRLGYWIKCDDFLNRDLEINQPRPFEINRPWHVEITAVRRWMRFPTWWWRPKAVLSLMDDLFWWPSMAITTPWMAIRNQFDSNWWPLLVLNAKLTVLINI